MKVLYLTNIHNPYRDEFFEQLGHTCDLTVLFEERSDPNRDASWFEDAHAHNYKELFLPPEERGPVSRTMLDLVSKKWSIVIVGCYNTSRQMAAIEYMKHHGISYVINSDGLVFDKGSYLKRIVRRHILKDASAYLVAGEACLPNLRCVVGEGARVKSYPMTSLERRRVESLSAEAAERNHGTVLIVGQYQYYKGLDVVLDAAADLSPDLRFRFVGAGRRSEELRADVDKRGLRNVSVIPFLDQDALAREYQGAGLFVLPSRQECWGLVVNEAAACGCPIVGTWGSGAAIDFISGSYPNLLAKPGDPSSLAQSIKEFYAFSDREKRDYSSYLVRKSADYTIESMVEAHLELFWEIAT